MTEEQIVKAVHAAHATGRVALTFIDQHGVEKPTNVLQTLLRELQAASAAPAQEPKAADKVFLSKLASTEQTMRLEGFPGDAERIRRAIELLSATHPA